MKAIALALIFACVGAPAWSQEAARWTLTYSDSEGLHKLVYGEEETEGEAYLRCRAGSGWVFAILDFEPKDGKSVEVAAGAETIKPSYRVQYDDVISDGFFVDMAIPADHPLFTALAKGHPLRFEGQDYPVATDVERNSILNFQTVCDGDD